MSFVHLHLHTEYSLLDGACRIGRLMEHVKSLGQTAVAITDHGVMYGVVDFYKAAKAAGVKPIIGCEVYVAPRTMQDKVHGIDNENRHLVLLCENETGYRNLSYMVSRGFLEGFYGRPRVDMALLRQHSEGLIALSACLAGGVPRLLAHDDYEGAKKLALEYSGIFGPDHFYLELQDHGLPEQARVNPLLLKLSRETGLPLVATNDAHYITKADASVQDVLMCIQMGKTVDDESRMRFETDEFYVKSEDEMRSLFPNAPEAIENTASIAARCNVEFEFGHYHLPQYTAPDGSDSLSYFHKLCEEGFRERYPNAPKEYRDRLDYEMQVIEKMGYVDYFLIVADFILWAKAQGIPVGPGRGSGAGSIAAYCMHITEMDPMQYALIFERFLNPERVSMPDFDTDFCQERRGEVIEYVMRKYGKDRVAQIVTFGTMAARGAVRDVGRALNMSYAETDVVAKAIPNELHMTLAKALEKSPQLRELYHDEKVRKLIDTAMGIEGMPRNTSTHAAGVVITARPVSDYVPLAKNDDTVVTQFPMTTIEELGLLKMDFLGLRNLTVIDDAEKQIQKTEPGFSMKKIRDDDPATFAMLGEGKTSGVFQLESAGITSVCVQMKPQSIEDMTAIVALYRPGPMDSIPKFIQSKQRPDTIAYITPQLEPILKVTYGCIVYQEQVIEIFRKLGGYTLGQSDNMRRAISKKKQAVIELERVAFVYGDKERGIPGAIANGVSEDAAQKIYDDILDFANYAFNKAHAVCYAKVSYDTAYLKCHYPRQYMAALMTSVLDSAGQIAGYIADCKDMGIRVLPPDVNHSTDVFSVEGDAIRFGLAAIKNVGRGLMKKLVSEREQNGAYRSLEDLCKRLQETELNKRAVENLIKCGALDSFGAKRSQLLQIYELVMDTVAESTRKNVAGQMGLFDMAEAEDTQPAIALPNIPELSPQEKMQLEKETTGLYLSGHPMDAYREQLKRARVAQISDVTGEDARYPDESTVTVAGIVQSVKLKTTRNNSMMAYVTLEDDAASVELLVFANALNQYGGWLQEGQGVVVTGKVSIRDEKEPQILLNRATPLKDLADPVLTEPVGAVTGRPPTEPAGTVTGRPPTVPTGAETYGYEKPPLLAGAEASGGRRDFIASSAAMPREVASFSTGDRAAAEESAPASTAPVRCNKLYLKLPSEDSLEFVKTRAILNMFPGPVPTVLYFADTGVRRGTACAPAAEMLQELARVLGSAAVVTK